MKNLFILVFGTVTLLVATAWLTSCNDVSTDTKFSEEQKKALAGASITGATPVMLDLLACSDSDTLWTSQSFVGKNAQGQSVSGTVCCGWLKGCTVRF